MKGSPAPGGKLQGTKGVGCKKAMFGKASSGREPTQSCWKHSLTPEITESFRLKETSKIIKSKLNITMSTKPYREGIRYLERNESPSAHRDAAEKFSMDPNLFLSQLYLKLKPWHSA